jgi:lipoprotein-anchoring transpeptidase ErfK/SrfK
MRPLHHHQRALAAALAVSVICAAPALAQPLAMIETPGYPNNIFREVLPAERTYERSMPRYDATAPADESNVEMPAHLRRQIVNYPTREAPGTIVIDTPNTYLYYVLGQGRAIRYGIGVGREGFTWSGVQAVSRKQEWPDWHPPAEMIARQPYLPRFMSGGPGNPLGARAMYLGNSMYRIHGTNAPSTIGQRVSSGCIRLTNEDAIDLYNRVSLGAKVVVLNGPPRRAPANVANAPVVPPAAENAMARYEQRMEEPVFWTPRPQTNVPAYDEVPVYRSANPYFGSSASRIY